MSSHPHASIGNLIDLLHTRVRETPEKTAFTYLPSKGNAQTLTYGELDQKVRAVAAALLDSGAFGERALLLYQPGLDYVVGFLGCIYAGVIAVPAYPPDPMRLARTLPRLQAIVHDAQPLLSLSTAAIRSMGASQFARDRELADLHWLATDTVAPALAERYETPDLDEEPLAFMQYTSGSTGNPKGVMLTHGNLLANFALVARSFQMNADDRVVSWLPPYHDMGLIGGILQAMYAGGESILMSPFSFLRNPRRWLEAITDYRATITGGPNFSYDLCVRKITEEQRDGLDLSSLRITYVAAEPIRAHTLQSFHEAFGPHGFARSSFWTGFGIAEATLVVSGEVHTDEDHTLTVSKEQYAHGRVVLSEPNSEDALTLVSCGPVAEELVGVVVDPETRRLCETDEIGELWIAGPTIAKQYWQAEKATQSMLKARLDDAPDRLANLEFLRTGDLGFLHDGQIFVAGRIKDLIILRGRNLHPQDIEAVAENSHPLLRPGCSAAFSVDDDKQERLVVVAELSKRAPADFSTDEIFRAVQRAVTEVHSARVDQLVLITPTNIPKTSSGKIRRRETRALFLAGELPLAGTNSPSTSA